MSYLDYDLGYDSGYDSESISTSNAATNNVNFAPEGPAVSYAMTPPRPTLPRIGTTPMTQAQIDALPPILRNLGNGSSPSSANEGATPAPGAATGTTPRGNMEMGPVIVNPPPSGDGDSTAPATGGRQPGQIAQAQTQAGETARAAAHGRRRVERSRPAATGSVPARFGSYQATSQQQPALRAVERSGLDPAAVFSTITAPRGRAAQTTHYQGIRGATPEVLRGRFAQANVRQWLNHYQRQGVSAEAAYQNIQARGMLPGGENVNLPTEYPGRRHSLQDLLQAQSPNLGEQQQTSFYQGRSADDLNRNHRDLQAVQSQGLGPRGAGRNQTVREDTARVNLTESWIDHMAGMPGWDRQRAVGTLEQMETPLMQNGRVTGFDLNEGAAALYRAPAGQDAVLTSEHALVSGAAPIVPGSGDGASAIETADNQAQSRRAGLQGIQDRFSGLGFNDQEQRAVMMAQTSFGGPLVDEHGDLLPNVTPRQVELYGQQMDQSMQSISDTQGDITRVEGRLAESGLSDSRRTALTQQLESHQSRLQRNRDEVAGEVRTGTADYYRSQMPGHLRRVGLNSEQATQLMNGRGYLGENVDLAHLANGYREVSGQDRSARAGLISEITENESGSYVRPVGDTDAGRQAEAIGRSYTRAGRATGGARRGGRAGDRAALQNDQQEFQREERIAQQEFQRGQQVRQDRQQERMAGINNRYATEREQTGHEFRLEEQRIQAGYQMLQSTMQGLMQGINQTTEGLRQQATQTVQQMFQAGNQMAMPRAVDANTWYANAGGRTPGPQ